MDTRFLHKTWYIWLTACMMIVGCTITFTPPLETFSIAAGTRVPIDPTPTLEVYAPEPGDFYEVWVHTSEGTNLNVRSSFSLTAPVVVSYPRGTRLLVDRAVSEGVEGWLHVENPTDFVFGWVVERWVTTEPEAL